MGEETPEMTQFSWEVAQGRLISNALLGFYCCQRVKGLGEIHSSATAGGRDKTANVVLMLQEEKSK